MELMPESATWASRTMALLFGTRLGRFILLIAFAAFMFNQFQVWREDNSSTFNAYLIAGITATIMALIVSAWFGRAQQRAVQRRYNNLPESGPWDVNITTQPTSQGRQLLTIDVKFTKEDWRAILTMGLQGAELMPIFPKNPEEAQRNRELYGRPDRALTPWKLMQGTNSVEDDDAIIVEHCKQKLVENLQNLRAQIEAWRDRHIAGPNMERLEI